LISPHLQKIKLENRPVLAFPAAYVGADVSGRPNYFALGRAVGTVCRAAQAYKQSRGL